MPDYKLIDAEQLDSDLKRVADSIRSKANTSDSMDFPEEFISTIEKIVDTYGTNALAKHILKNKTAFVNGEKVTGTMPDNGDTSKSFDGITEKSVTIPEGYTLGGTISLTDDIEMATAEIKTAIAEKGVTVPEDASINELAALVESIQTSGGSGGGDENTEDVRAEIITYLEANGIPYSEDASLSELAALLNPTSTGKHGNNFTWRYYDNTETLVISGTGAMSYGFDKTALDLPYKHLVFGEGITSISNDFSSNGLSDYMGNTQYIYSVSLPSTLKSIGDKAFMHYNFNDFNTFSLPEGLESIGESAFLGVLYSYADGGHSFNLVIPSTIKSIGATAFQMCCHLKTVTIKGKPTSIQSNAFESWGESWGYFLAEEMIMNVSWAQNEVSGEPWGWEGVINYNQNV